MATMLFPFLVVKSIYISNIETLCDIKNALVSDESENMHFCAKFVLYDIKIIIVEKYRFVEKGQYDQIAGKLEIRIDFEGDSIFYHQDREFRIRDHPSLNQ
jgi:hypothetical protein